MPLERKFVVSGTVSGERARGLGGREGWNLEPIPFLQGSTDRGSKLSSLLESHLLQFDVTGQPVVQPLLHLGRHGGEMLQYSGDF